jgi:hypothetical protein
VGVVVGWLGRRSNSLKWKTIVIFRVSIAGSDSRIGIGMFAMNVVSVYVQVVCNAIVDRMVMAALSVHSAISGDFIRSETNESCA